MIILKIGDLLIKIGKKISSKKKNKDKNKNNENVKLYSNNDGDDGPCWWVFNKPSLPKIFK